MRPFVSLVLLSVVAILAIFPTSVGHGKVSENEYGSMESSPMAVSDQIIKDVRLALKAGDSNGLSRFFSTNVSLKTNGEEGNYSKSQAQFVMKKFFRDFPPGGFDYNHQGSSPGGAIYTIGTYEGGGKSFRVYTLYKKVNDGYLISRIEFTRE